MGAPSLFDLCVLFFLSTLPIFNVGKIDVIFVRGMYLVYSTFILMCVGLMENQRRIFRSVPLALITIWSLGNVFIYNFYAKSIFKTWYVNWYTMNEGFIYILCGVLLIKTIVEHAKAYRWYYIPSIIILIAYILAKGFDFRSWGYVGWSMTPLLAVVLGGIATLIKAKKVRLMAYYALIPGIILILYKFKWIVYKFTTRPLVWSTTIRDIIASNGLGRGFDETINGMNGLILTSEGRGYINSDLLELGRNLGLPAMALITWFFAWLLIKGKPSIGYFLVTSAVIASLVQRNMHFHTHAGIILVYIALLILESGLAKHFSPTHKEE